MLKRSSLLAESNRLPQGILIIGIGNDYRSDDAAGLVVARMLQQQVADETSAEAPADVSPPNRMDMTIIEHSGEGSALLEAWRGWEHVILIDAVCSGARPGTIHCFDAEALALPANLFASSSHAFSVAQAVELGRALAQLPRHLLLYGIEGKRFAAGVGLSPEVQQAVQEVVGMSASYSGSSSSASRPRRKRVSNE
jgi:hydrogenase maturation protease